ncbi:MAG: DNA/RNA non-specific endonuclease [Lachnospiraceae bacterium]|nr:DNA/RNA non-specific endonuclease [Lachnospiraceae bacterium]
MKNYLNRVIILFSILSIVSCGKVAKNAGRKVAKSTIKTESKTALKKSVNNDIKNIIGKKVYDEIASTGMTDIAIDEIAKMDKEVIDMLLKDIKKDRSLVKIFNDNPDRIMAYNRLSNTSKRTDCKLIEWLADCEYKSTKTANANKLRNKYSIKDLKIAERDGRIIFYDGDAVVAEYSNSVFYTKRGTPGNPNNFLNFKPMPNSTYKVESFIYTTDKLGRVKRISVKNVKIKANENNTRNSDLQAIARDEKGGLVGEKKGRVRALDDGGHLIADILDGPCELINIVPMANKANKSEFKSVENFIRQSIAEREKVSYYCDVIYDGSNPRPTKFNIKVTVSNKPKIFTIKNI